MIRRADEERAAEVVEAIPHPGAREVPLEVPAEFITREEAAGDGATFLLPNTLLG